MPLDSTHPQFDSSLGMWKTVQDVIEGGEEGVKEGNERYLPLLADQDTEAYGKYKLRAEFFNASGRTKAALMGFLFRKDPDVKLPENPGPQMSAFVTDASLTGKALYDVAGEIAEKVLIYGRYGTVIDWNEDENQPFVTNYAADDIRNWRYKRVNGRMELEMLILHEYSDEYVNTGDGEKPPDEYQQVVYDQWREWRLLSDGQGGDFVSCTVWRRRKGGRTSSQAGLKGTGDSTLGVGVTGSKDFIPIARYFPKRGTFPLTEIPFVFHSPVGPHGDGVVRPPLLDMVNINLSLYRTSADLENALHMLGVPTPFIAGFTDKTADEVVLGATKCLVTENAQAHGGFIELSGTGLKSLETAVERKEKHMAALGARMLDHQNSVRGNPEAFATVALRQTGETAVLTSISLALTLSLTDVLAWAYWWCNRGLQTPEDAEKIVSYTLTTDFLGTKMDAPTATALFQMYIGGGISFETFFQNLQQGEIIPANVTLEEEKAAIQEGQSLLLAMAAPPEQPAKGGNDQSGSGTSTGQGAV